MIWLMLIVAAWCAVLLAACWVTRRGKAAAPDEPVPYWPASSNPCTWCRPSPEGMCTCTSVCGHINCIGDHTSLATLTAKDMRLLHKWIREGHK